MADVSKVKINNVTYDIKDAKAVSKSGDTMTGDLSISKSSEADIYLKNTNVTLGTAPSANTWVGGYNCRDNSNTDVSYIGSQYLTDKSMLTRIINRTRDNNNQSVDNYFDLYSHSDGTKSVYFSNPEAWRKGLGLGDSGWQTYTDNTIFTGSIFYRKVGDVLYFSTGSSIYLLSNCTDYVSLGTMPSGYRPSKDVVLNCYINTEGVNRPLGARINASGIIYIYANNGEPITTGYPIYMSGCGI